MFTAKAGSKCGLFLHEFAAGRGHLLLFFPGENSSAETWFHFREFVLAHAKRRALDGTVELVRFFVCPDCGDPVSDSYMTRFRFRAPTSLCLYQHSLRKRPQEDYGHLESPGCCNLSFAWSFHRTGLARFPELFSRMSAVGQRGPGRVENGPF